MNWHLAQAKCYAYIYLPQMTEKIVQMTYCTQENR